MITLLTSAQYAQFAVYRARWTAIGLSTEPANRPEAERGVHMAYAQAGLRAPRIIWTTSPMAQALAREATLFSRKKRASVWDSLWASARASARANIKANVRANVRANIRDNLWANLMTNVWGNVGYNVVANGWGNVGYNVVANPGASIGHNAWESAWESVWDSLWDSAGVNLRETAFGQHDAYWLAGYAYAAEQLDLRAQCQPLAGIRLIAEHAGWWLPHEDVCWVSERHTLLNLDTQRRLHCPDGLAVGYPDGWGVYAWHGIRVPAKVIMDPGAITQADILQERNAQIRRVMVERLGVERVCQLCNAKVISAQGTYELLSLDLNDGRRRPYLKMRNPSIGVYHLEGVHPDCTTVQEALNWRNGLTEEQIDEINGTEWQQQGDVILRPAGATTYKSQPAQLT